MSGLMGRIVECPSTTTVNPVSPDAAVIPVDEATPTKSEHVMVASMTVNRPNLDRWE